MSMISCMVRLNLGGKIPDTELKETADEYVKRGLSPDAAILRAVEEKLESAKMDEASIIKTVRAAYEAKGGKPRVVQKVEAKAEPVETDPVESKAAPNKVTGTPAFKKWFGESEVIDANGEPLVMYHGTSSGGFSTFDTYASNYGLMGMGGYFTADPHVASSYTTKGKGDAPTVYPVYLSIKHPLHMDAKADAEKWKNQFDGIEDFHEGGDTNESWYRAAEDLMGDQRLPKWEGAEAMQDGLRTMGYDGIEHTGGGRVAADGVRHQVYIAFDPEQIKSATGNGGEFDGSNPDIMASRRLADSSRDLVITHNLTEDNLLHAEKMGGIAVPSLSVTRHDSTLEGFGGITLIGSRDLADPKGYASTKVFGADIYSPRYPDVSHKLDRLAVKNVNRAIDGAREALGLRELSAHDISSVRDLADSTLVRYQTLLDMGVKVDPVRREDGTIDSWATENAVRRAVADNNAYGAVDKKAKDILAKSGAEERIFQGYTSSGNQKYVPHTLENVVKILKKELRGGESFNYGVGSIRSKFTPQFKSIEQIQKAKDKLVSKSQMDAVKDEINKEFDGLADSLKPFHSQGNSFGFGDTVSAMMGDAATMGLPRALEANGFKGVTPEAMVPVRDFLEKLRDMPTQYFEAKILRDVDLSEFSGAVIPKDTSPEARAALEKRGIPFKEYGSESERAAAVSDFSRELDAKNGDVMFSRGFDPERRQLLAAAAGAALSAGARAGDVNVGKAAPIDPAVFSSHVTPDVERILRDAGQGGLNGAATLRKAMLAISESGPKQLRPLAAQIERLLPKDGVQLTIDDTSRLNLHGLVRLSPSVHMTLLTAEGRTGLTYETLLHEALHVAVAARYKSLSVGMERENDGVTGLKVPRAADALRQFHDVWSEFKDATGAENFADRQLAMVVGEARANPDEFFVRALTDPTLQRYLAGKHYEGQTLWQRFKDWVKTSLLGIPKSGTAPSWLDAALTASHDLSHAMEADKADFSRMGALARVDGPYAMESRMAEPPENRDADDPQKRALSRIIGVPKEMLASVVFNARMMVVPMAAGAEKAMVIAKDFMNGNRRAQAQWNAFDKVLRANYSEDQLKKMWVAADQENDLRRDGNTSKTLGLASLDAGERKTVELLHQYGEQLWNKAKDAGLVTGDGVDFWTPRVAARIVEDGTAESIRQPVSEFSKDAKNLKTSASSTKERKYATTAESEAALKGAAGDDAEYVKNIRVMPMAMAQLERAIAGRTLVNQIRAHGKLAGEELLSDEGKPNFVTFDHPALKQWRPKMDWAPVEPGLIEQRGYEVRKDGVYRAGEKLASYRIQDGEVQKLGPMLDSDGKAVMESSPLYVRKDFAGPLKAVFTKDPGAVYQGLMALKGGITSMIMVSPLTHNLVIWGKAMPTMISTMGWKNNLKNAGSLGLHAYFVGHTARADHALMGELVDAGLVPVSGRGMNQDVAAIANGIQPGRSMTARAAGAAFDLVSKNAGDNARKAVDAAGEFWHEKLLWDRVADMQAGMAVMMRTSLMDKGLDQRTASLVASHFANRYAGMIPAEAMSQLAHVTLNLSLFSKTFTMTNLGAYKDLIGGLPKDVQAQIRLRTFELQRALGKGEVEANDAANADLAKVQRIARAKAATVLVLDIAAMTSIASITQALWQGQSGQQIADDFKERLAKLGHKIKDDPMAIIGHPLDALSSLSQTSDNPYGREDRVRLGEDEHGNSYYGRLPVGKVGEELKQYSNLDSGLHLLHNKMSTFLRPIADLTAKEDFSGKRIINPHDNGLKQVAAFGAYWVKSQLPLEDLAALSHVARGDADTMDKLKLMGTATGLSVGKLSGGDAVAEMRHQNQEQAADLRDVLPDVREAIRRDDIDKARQLLEDAGQTPREIQSTIKRLDNPGKVSPQQLRKFNAHSTDDEREKLDRMRSR